MEELGSGQGLARRWLIRFPRAVPIAIFLLIAAITLLSCYAIERFERQNSELQLRERAGTIASALERRANANAAYLRAGSALFATLEIVPPDRFRRFVSELRLDSDFRGSEGIGWAQRVDHSWVGDFNRLIATEYGEDVRFFPELAPEQPFAVPVTFLEPHTEHNHNALGYDMYSQPARRAAMEDAESTARPSASGRLMLAQEGGGFAPGFIVYMPVFDARSDSARLQGFVFSAFNAQGFLEAALDAEQPPGSSIRLYDRETGAEQLLASIEPGSEAGPAVQVDVLVANRPWVLEVAGAKQPALSPLAISALLFGLAIAVLLTVLLRMLTRQSIEDHTRLRWFEEQNAIRDSLTRELNHRVKNTLANVLSIIALTSRRAGNVEEFAEGLDGRIRALSATHDLLTQSEWGTTPLSSVIKAELAPYERDFGPVIGIHGPDIELAPNDALSLGLAIHELATNAAKYGALSQPGGQLSIGWEPVDEDKVRIDWVESGGPPVPGTRDRGFGLDLIEKIVAHELQNPVELEFDPAGVRCSLVVPVRKPQQFELHKRSQPE